MSPSVTASVTTRSTTLSALACPLHAPCHHFAPVFLQQQISCSTRCLHSKLLPKAHGATIHERYSAPYPRTPLHCLLQVAYSPDHFYVVCFLFLRLVQTTFEKSSDLNHFNRHLPLVTEASSVIVKKIKNQRNSSSKLRRGRL